MNQTDIMMMPGGPGTIVNSTNEGAAASISASKQRNFVSNAARNHETLEFAKRIGADRDQDYYLTQ